MSPPTERGTLFAALGHGSPSKPLLRLEPRPPGTKNTRKTSTFFPFFLSFFFFWYKMIQTTIQNSCAVDDYKTSWNVCLTAQCSESQCEYIILLLSFPKTTTVMRAAAHCVHLQKETCKKKKKTRMEKGEKAKAKRVPIVHRRGSPAGPDHRAAPIPCAPGCHELLRMTPSVGGSDDN